MRTDFLLHALEQALYDRQPASPDALVHHSDRGSQYRQFCFPAVTACDRSLSAGLSESDAVS